MFCKCFLKFYLPDVKTRYNLYADINVNKTRLMFRRTRWNPTKSLHVTILYFLLTLFWITRPTKMIMQCIGNKNVFPLKFRNISILNNHGMDFKRLFISKGFNDHVKYMSNSIKYLININTINVDGLFTLKQRHTSEIDIAHL